MFVGAAFTDQADIKVDSDVVDTLVSLGVVNGYTDGSFKPNDTVTRAEMAKMIYVLRTGNSDASAYNDDYSTFADIKGHWARGYVKYCQSLGIIAGQSATKFAPDQTVTAQEAAKMLLVTLGYDAQKAGLVGTTWAAKTNALADENGLLEDVNTSFTGPCPRQYAAQLIYNAIDAPTVVWRDDAYTNQNYNGKDNQTIGEKYMGLSKTVGILEEVSKDNDKNTYSLYVNSDKYEDECSGKKLLNNFTKLTKDYSALKYQKVKVLYKDKDKVFGVYSMTDDNTVVSAVMDDVKMDSDTKIKIDGTKYTVDAKSTVYVNGKDTNTKIADWVKAHSEGENIGKASTVQAISNNDSNKINILKVTTFTTKKVTYVGKDYVNAGKKYEEDDANFPSDLKKDDYVAISAKENYADTKDLLTKLETVEGKVTGTKGKDKVLIDGTWYTADYATGSKNVIDNWPSNGATVKLVLLNGFVQLVDTVTVGSSDFALVIETGTSNGLGSSKVADVLFADGTRKTVDLDNDSYYQGTTDTKSTVAVKEKAPKLATYELSKGKYTFKAVSDKALNGYDAYASGSNLTIDGKVKAATVSGEKNATNVFMKDTGVVFVQYKKSGDYEYKVVTGKDAANWKETTGITLQGLIKVDSGVKYAEMAVITMANNIPGGSDTTYAFAVDDSYQETIDGTKYTCVEAWNGSEIVTMKSDDTNVSFHKREAFEYSINSDGTYDLTKLEGKNSATQNYEVTQIVGYDKTSGELTFATGHEPVSKEYKITKDTVILYVDSDAKKGAGEFDIEVAQNNKNNVIYYAESGDDYIRLIVVDCNNEMKQ